MSQLPSDPLAHISEIKVPKESLMNIAKHIVQNCLSKVYAEFTTGRNLVLHVALSMAREENIAAHDYLVSIEDGRRAFAEIYMFFGKLAVMIGPEVMGRRFATTYRRLEARYQQRVFDISPTVAPQSPIPIPDSSVGRRIRYDEEEFRETLSVRAEMDMIPNEGNTLWYLTNPKRSIIKSTDPDIIQEVCRYAEEKRVLAELPTYSFRGENREFFISALAGVVKMSLLRKKNLFKFVADLKYHTSFMAKGKRPLPDILTLSLFLATIKNPDPDIYISSIEVAAFIYGEGINSFDDLKFVMASRCVTSLPSKGGIRGEEGFMDGWSLYIREPERGNRERFETSEKDTRRDKRSGRKGPDKSFYASGLGTREMPQAESRLSNIQLDNLLHKVLAGTKVHWVSASFLDRIKTRPLLKCLKRGNRVLVPLCVFNHWILGRMSPRNNEVDLEIYDSAPSAQTKAEIKNIFAGPAFSQFGKIKISHIKCPKQPENSSQCGLHLLLNATAIAKGKKLNSTTACYESLLPLNNEIEFSKRLRVLVAKMPDASHSEGHQKGQRGKKEYTTQIRSPEANVDNRTKKDPSKRPPQTGSKISNRAGGSAKIEQRSMPKEVTLTLNDRILFNQEDNLALNVPVPKQMTCLFGDNTTCVHVRRVLESPEGPTTLTKPYSEALALSTQKGHRRILRFLRDNLPETNAPLDATLVCVMQRLQKEKNWAASTLLTKMAQAQGALRLIFLYRRTESTITLKDCIRWKLAMKGVAVELQTHTPIQPKPITEEQVKAAQKIATPQISALIELSWLLAGRGGDVLQLQISDIKDQGDYMTVTFRRGKTARRQQYTVGIPRPSPHTMNYLRGMKTWVFPGVRGESLKDALRAVDPDLEQRSLRRGRLIHLAAKGWSDTALLEVSRHATVAMLRRYLDMGTASSTTAQTGRRAISPAANEDCRVF